MQRAGLLIYTVHPIDHAVRIGTYINAVYPQTYAKVMAIIVTDDTYFISYKLWV